MSASAIVTLKTLCEGAVQWSARLAFDVSGEGIAFGKSGKDAKALAIKHAKTALRREAVRDVEIIDLDKQESAP